MYNAFIFNGIVVYTHLDELVKVFSFKHPTISNDFNLKEEAELTVTFIPHFDSYLATVTIQLLGEPISSIPYDDFIENYERINLTMEREINEIELNPDYKDLYDCSLETLKESVQLDRSIQETVIELYNTVVTIG